jgi:hypothetical protein
MIYIPTPALPLLDLAQQPRYPYMPYYGTSSDDALSETLSPHYCSPRPSTALIAMVVPTYSGTGMPYAPDPATVPRYMAGTETGDGSALSPSYASSPTTGDTTSLSPSYSAVRPTATELASPYYPVHPTKPAKIA